VVGTKKNITSFKKGHIHTERIKNKIRRTLKKYFKTHSSYNKGKKLSLKTKMKISKNRTGIKCSEKQKRFMSKKMKGRATLWLKGKPINSKGHHLTEEHKEKLRTTIQKHHIDLDKQNNKKRNILYLQPKTHQYLHKWAYRYLVEKKEIKKYYKWFKEKLKRRNNG